MAKQFQRRTEDFVCEKCGEFVRGSGYTNHCPKCLWSKHVDIFPGDRQARCGGLMEPGALVLNKGEYSFTHCCIVCGHTKKNKTAADDNFEALLALTGRLAGE